jgi:lactate dehydrogenase-like 2-hydroxyacid dehydrogenase
MLQMILLFPRFTRDSIPANHRLGLIAKVGVGYDNVDVPACTEAGRRPGL